MSVVLWENLISRRRSRRTPADAGLPLVRYNWGGGGGGGGGQGNVTFHDIQDSAGILYH